MMGFLRDTESGLESQSLWLVSIFFSGGNSPTHHVTLSLSLLLLHLLSPTIDNRLIHRCPVLSCC